MKKLYQVGAGMILAAALFGGAPSAQMLPDTVDPYELAPKNVHLYPVSLNARLPYFYVPPIFAPRPMWRGALTAAEVHQFAPHNYIVYEVPDSTALVAWGTVKHGGKNGAEDTVVLESANQQQFLILPPKAVDDGSSYMLATTRMRFVPKDHAADLNREFERELIIEPKPRVQSIAESLPVDQLMYNYERVEDVADMQPYTPLVLRDELATDLWPVERIYISYSGWRRDPNRLRTMGDFVPQWFTFEGKMVALKEDACGWFMLTVELEGYNPWFPHELQKNFMRKLIALSFDEFVETTRYYDVERPLDGKEWHRSGSPHMTPYDTRRNVGGGSAGQGAY